METVDLKSNIKRLPINKVFHISVRKVDELLSQHNGFNSYFPGETLELLEVKLTPFGTMILKAQPYMDGWDLRYKDEVVETYKLHISQVDDTDCAWTMQECVSILKDMY